MELRVLNYFLAIAREENFTRAAQQLHVTQPTLSRQIADLEQELGVTMFRRSNHNVVLTEDGMILKRRAQELLTLADKAKRDFLHRGEQLEGTVAIGSGEFLATRCPQRGGPWCRCAGWPDGILIFHALGQPECKLRNPGFPIFQSSQQEGFS